jgi:hypothetical protein
LLHHDGERQPKNKSFQHGFGDELRNSAESKQASQQKNYAGRYRGSRDQHMYRPASARASGATNAASIAAEDEVDVTASWREVPNIAYTNMPSIAAYKPT